MSAIGNARFLRVLVIDDEPQDVLMTKEYGFSTYLVITQIASWADAQRIMASGGTIDGADILLVDVSMEKDDDIKKASKNEGSATILPAGPIIALPFIGKRAVMSYMVYSAHMKNPDLQRHPFFLIAMGLIMARTEGLTKGKAMLSTHLSTGAGPFQLDKTIEEMLLHASAAAVLWPAVKDYRERLANMVYMGEVTIRNRQETIAALDRLRGEVAKDENIVISDDIRLAIVGQNWSDCISIRSLFADELKSSAYATLDWINEVKAWLETLGDSDLERALNVIHKQDEAENQPRGQRPNATKVISEHYGNLEVHDQRVILRLVVLFANVFALDHPHETLGLTRQCVYDRLGTGILQHTYEGWFSEREPKKKCKRLPKKRETKNPFKDLSRLSPGEQKFDRCFLSTNSTVSREDHEAILQYRSSEGEDEWIDPPYSVMEGSSRH